MRIYTSLCTVKGGSMPCLNWEPVENKPEMNPGEMVLLANNEVIDLWIKTIQGWRMVVALVEESRVSNPRGGYTHYLLCGRSIGIA